MKLRNRFSKKDSVIDVLVPSGLIASTEKGFYYVKGNKRFKFVSDRARDSWSLKVVRTTEFAMSSVPVSGLLGFRDGSLLKDVSDGKIYLISDNKRRHIASPDVFLWAGNDIIEVGEKEISIHQLGDKLHG